MVVVVPFRLKAHCSACPWFTLLWRPMQAKGSEAPGCLPVGLVCLPVGLACLCRNVACLGHDSTWKSAGNSTLRHRTSVRLLLCGNVLSREPKHLPKPCLVGLGPWSAGIWTSPTSTLFLSLVHSTRAIKPCSHGLWSGRTSRGT